MVRTQQKSIRPQGPLPPPRGLADVLRASHHCPSPTPASSNILDRGVHEYFEQIDVFE
ncbi:hypothetical protein M405DRAFT_822371, partial [Rhizopogon salebrosus TDB-379]